MKRKEHDRNQTSIFGFHVHLPGCSREESPTQRVRMRDDSNHGNLKRPRNFLAVFWEFLLKPMIQGFYTPQQLTNCTWKWLVGILTSFLLGPGLFFRCKLAVSFRGPGMYLLKKTRAGSGFCHIPISDPWDKWYMCIPTLAHAWFWCFSIFSCTVGKYASPMDPMG